MRYQSIKKEKSGLQPLIYKTTHSCLQPYRDWETLNSKLDKGTYDGNAEDLKNDIDGKANISHTHDISNVTNLQPTLNSKLDKGTYDGTAQNLKNDIDGKANISHTHDISNVNNLQPTLNSKLDKDGYEGTSA